ncbi:MAG: 50S ribosomal protein L9, partial [Bacteroidetes bacterium]|nr:50S ribosomal protein L9 [Bacteroidota bacterium]
MRVILLKDIPKIGHKNEVRNVADGYAQNFLVPKRLVTIATKSSEADLIKQKEKDGAILKANEG